MTDLIAIITPDPLTSRHVLHIVNSQPWRKAFLIIPSQHSMQTKNYQDNLPPHTLPSRTPLSLSTLPPYASTIPTDFSQPIKTVVSNLTNHLKPHIQGTEVGLNLIAGDGKQHMAVLSAILQCGVGFRLIALTQEGVIEV